MPSKIHGGVVFPTSSSFLRVGLWEIQHHSPHAFLYCLGIRSISFSSSLPFPFPCFSWLLMEENYNRISLLQVSLLTLHTILGRSMLMAQMALFESAMCQVILMSWAIISLPTLRQWVRSSLYSFSFYQFSIFVSVINLSFFEMQPTIQEHEEMVWLPRDLKLEVTNYSRNLYCPKGAAYLGGGDNDDSGKEDDPKATPSYQLRKRWHYWLPAIQEI